ncbi:hypothetical protein AVEN_5755-1 [Araneus ventricosus]|uniref:Uncharacterized protein n=1 Tax=Araneus ventricosus TaxID=182803 RepID=A0A4Y2DZ14_ARAVE|nr:hypothetical protein AVEN_5755-1 [Araneus ventricosus]
MPETGLLTKYMDKQFEKQLAMIAEIKAGQAEMQSGQERMEKVQEEMKGMIDEVKSEVKGKIEEMEHKVQGKIADIERRLSELEDTPFSFQASPEFMLPRPTIKSLTFDG